MPLLTNNTTSNNKRSWYPSADTVTSNAHTLTSPQPYEVPLPHPLHRTAQRCQARFEHHTCHLLNVASSWHHDAKRITKTNKSQAQAINLTVPKPSRFQKVCPINNGSLIWCGRNKSYLYNYNIYIYIYIP